MQRHICVAGSPDITIKEIGDTTVSLGCILPDLLHLFYSSRSSRQRALSMAPELTLSMQDQSPGIVKRNALRSIFPDGIKTSGQHPPIYEQLRSYEEFPEEIIGPTVWNAEDYRNNPERWTHWLSEDEIAELSDAANKFKAASIPLTGISKVSSIPPCYLFPALT